MIILGYDWWIKKKCGECWVWEPLEWQGKSCREFFFRVLFRELVLPRESLRMPRGGELRQGRTKMEEPQCDPGTRLSANTAVVSLEREERQLWIWFQLHLVKIELSLANRQEMRRRWLFPGLLSCVLPFPFIGIKIIMSHDDNVFSGCLEAAILSAHKYLWEWMNQRVWKCTLWASYYSTWA